MSTKVSDNPDTPSSAGPELPGSLPASADRTIVSSPKFPRTLGPYSQAVVSGGFVFVAGQAPINPITQEFELGIYARRPVWNSPISPAFCKLQEAISPAS